MHDQIFRTNWPTARHAEKYYAVPGSGISIINIWKYYYQVPRPGLVACTYVRTIEWKDRTVDSRATREPQEITQGNTVGYVITHPSQTDA